MRSAPVVRSRQTEPMHPEVERLLEAATVEELVALTAGHNFWHTKAIARLGIPAMRVTDGPVGARGTKYDGPASINVPCSTLLAATFDPSLVERVGAVLGREALAKGASVLLAPTVNLHRTPVGGRNFECMSEDAFLTSRLAVAYVRGVQSQGVASCIKHFVGNDTEFERNSIDSRIDERTLRELYLLPFEAAVREAGVMAVMSSYNRINGPWAADSPLLADVLRGEWGFDGLVMSDWFGLHSTVEGIVAGLDLEMPGPTQHRGAALVGAVERGEVPVADVRARAGAVLELMARTGALFADGPGPETTRHDESDIALVRQAAAQGMVLLKNSAAQALPLQPERLRRVAVIGPNAAKGEIMGGGSAHVTPTAVSNPLDALRSRLEAAGVEVVHHAGCNISKKLPEIDARWYGGLEIDYFEDVADLDRADAVPHSTRTLDTTRIMWTYDPIGRGGPRPRFGARLRAVFTPDVSGPWTFGVESVAPVRIFVDGQMVLDNTDEPFGGSFFGMGRAEKVVEVPLEAGVTVPFVVEMRQGEGLPNLPGLNLGALPPVIGDPVESAVDLASTCDLTILVVGTNDDWESEGWDRSTLDLPGRQDELIQRVAAVSPATVVVVNAGSPVAMPWLDAVDAVVMAWFPGQEMGAALVDVLTGDVEPQGRLPVSFPARMEDTPAFEHHPGRNGVAHYLEGRLMGHHWYSTVGRQPLFPFGHGIGYGCAGIADVAAPDAFTVTATLFNEGTRDAVEVLQVYAHCLDRSGLDRDEPVQRLVGFVKVPVAVGERVAITIPLHEHTYRRWDVSAGAWRYSTSPHELRLARSATDIVAAVEVQPFAPA